MDKIQKKILYFIIGYLLLLTFWVCACNIIETCLDIIIKNNRFLKNNKLLFNIFLVLLISYILIKNYNFNFNINN